MAKLIDLTGQRFGSLTVSEKYSVTKNGACCWVCLCDCGRTAVISGAKLRQGVTKTCGSKEHQAERASSNFAKHKKSNTRLYNIWQKMKQRCSYAGYHAFNHYGGRGIKVCDEWLHNFQSFYYWAMANGYTDSLSIDRIDNDKGYSPENCRWIPFAEQSRNRRCVKND